MRRVLSAFAAVILAAATGFDARAGNSAPYEVYVMNEHAAGVTVINGSTLEVVASLAPGKLPAGVEPGKQPSAMVFTPDGTKAYARGDLDGTIKVIDARKHAVTAVISLDIRRTRLMDAVISPDGRSLYVSTGAARQVIHVDTRIDKVLRKVTVGARPAGLAVSPDGRRIFCANGPSNDISVIDANAFKVIATIPVGKSPWGVAVAPSRPRAEGSSRH